MSRRKLHTKKHRPYRCEKLEERHLLTTILGLTPPADDGIVPEGSRSIEVSFSGELDDAAGQDPFELYEAGNDGLLGTADDVAQTIVRVRYRGDVLQVDTNALPEGLFRVTVDDTLQDSGGQPIDGDGDGGPGGDGWVDFVVERPEPPQLDSTFGHQGYAHAIPYGVSNATLTSMHRQADGNVIATTSTSVFRILEDGTVDTNYGVDGFGPRGGATDSVLLPSQKLLTMTSRGGGATTLFG